MTKNITYCDHCGKTLDPMKDATEITIDLHYHMEYYMDNWKVDDVDLCHDCLEELWNFINKFCGGAAQ